jgi:hypothetical protein
MKMLQGVLFVVLLLLQEEVDQVLQRAHWDDEAEVWVLERLSDPNPAAAAAFSGGGSSSSYSQPASASAGSRGAGLSSKSRGQQQQQQQQQGCGAGVMPGSCRPIAVLGARRPTSNFTKAAALAGDMNPRFRCERCVDTIVATLLWPVSIRSKCDTLRMPGARRLAPVAAVATHLATMITLWQLQQYILVLLLALRDHQGE